jgi:hypothetical protein
MYSLDILFPFLYIRFIQKEIFVFQKKKGGFINGKNGSVYATNGWFDSNCVRHVVSGRYERGSCLAATIWGCPKSCGCG